mgnify:CR=1 FL=1
MYEQNATELLNDTIRLADGRSDVMKQRLISGVKNAIDREDAVNAVRMALTYDWRRTEMNWYRRDYNLLSIDYRVIVDRFWRQWRRTSTQYDKTYVMVMYGVSPKTRNGQLVIGWTTMNIFIGDTYDRLRRHIFYLQRPYETFRTEEFEMDKTQVFKWVREHQKIESRDAKITVNVYGTYGNMRRNLHTPFFEYLNSAN